MNIRDSEDVSLSEKPSKQDLLKRFGNKKAKPFKKEATAEDLINSYLGEGKAAMFDLLKPGETFTLPGKASTLRKVVYQKLSPGRAVPIDAPHPASQAIDVLPSDFVIRWP